MTKTILYYYMSFYQCLRRRLKGVPSRFQNIPVNYTLNKHQENALWNWVYQLDRAGCPPNAQQIEKCANSFLRRSHTDPQSKPLEVGQNWAYHFIKRLPKEYKPQEQKPKILLLHQNALNLAVNIETL